MSGKQAKRYRALDRRVELLQTHVDLLESGIGCTSRQYAEMAYRDARAARRRERDARRRESIWRTVALAAALIVAVLAAWALRGAEPEEPEPAAVVRRWIGCDLV